MTESAAQTRYPLVLVRLREAGPSNHSLDDAARMAGIHPELLRHYCRLGILRVSMATPALSSPRSLVLGMRPTAIRT